MCFFGWGAERDIKRTENTLQQEFKSYIPSLTFILTSYEEKGGGGIM